MSFSKEQPFLLVGAGKMGGAMLSGWMAWFAGNKNNLL